MEKCKYCKKDFEPVCVFGRKQLYCSISCQRKQYYQVNKERIIQNSARWQKANPEKTKVTREKVMKKYYENNRDKFNELMKKQYHLHKDRWTSRTVTAKIIRGKGYNPYKIPNPNCKLCNSSKNLTIRNTTYPMGKKAICEAIDKGEIYYVCKQCRKK